MTLIIDIVLANEIKYEVDDAEDAYWLYAQFVTFVYGGCTIALLTDCGNNLTYQDLTKAGKCFSSNEKIYLDLRRYKGYMNELESFARSNSKLTLTVTLKNAATKKMRLRMTSTPEVNTTTPSRSES